MPQGVHNHTLKRQEISKWSCQVTPPVWGKNYNLPAVRRGYPAAGGKKTVLVIAYIPYTHREIRQISVKIPTPGSKYDFFE
jgi:hypothetical protein